MVKYIVHLLAFLTLFLFDSSSFAMDESYESADQPQTSTIHMQTCDDFRILDEKKQVKILSDLYHQIKRLQFANSIEFFKTHPSVAGCSQEVRCLYNIVQGVLCYTALSCDMDPMIAGPNPYDYAKRCLQRALECEFKLSWETFVALQGYLASISIETDDTRETALHHLRIALINVPSDRTDIIVNINYILGYYYMLNGEHVLAVSSFNSIINTLRTTTRQRKTVFGHEADRKLQEKILKFIGN